MDIYSWQQVLPARLEWFDDEIESLREFELDQQVSVRVLEHCSVLLGTPEASNRFYEVIVTNQISRFT